MADPITATVVDPGTRHLVRSLARFGITRAVSWVAGGALLVMLPRFLGDVSLGKLGFGLALTGMCGLISDLGVTFFLVKEVARTPARAGGLVVDGVALSLVLNTIASAAVLALLAVGGYDAVTREVVLVLCASMIVAGAGGAVQATLQGLHRMGTLAVSSVVTNYVNAAAVIAVLAAGGGVVLVALMSLVSNLAGLGVTTIDLTRRIRLRGRPRWRSCRRLARGGLPFLVGQAALAVYGQIDAVMLSFFATDAVIGWYSAALRIISFVQFVPAMLTVVVYPMLSATAAQPERFNTLVQRSISIVLLINLPMAVGIGLLPDRAIHLLGYPPGFEHSVVPLILLAVGTPMIALDMVVATALSAADRQRQWAMIGVVAAILNVLINLIAIPFTQTVYHNGAIGAAAVTTLTELFLLVTGVCLLPRGAVDRVLLVRSLRCLSASAAMAALVVPLRGAPLAVPVLAGALIFGAASVGVRAVSKDEIRLVVEHAVRRRDSPRWTPLSTP